MRLLSDHRRTLVRVCGGACLAVGMIASVYAPLEIYCFYMFTALGPFEYEGFTVGSLWFALLLVQNVGYYLVAAILVPVGIGLLRLRAWALSLLRSYAYVWLSFGVAGLVTFLASLPGLTDAFAGSKVAGVGVLVAVVGLAVPSAVLGAFRDAALGGVFRSGLSDAAFSGTAVRASVVLVFNILLVLLFHILMFFKSVFPLFGRLVFLRPGTAWLSAAAVVLGILAYLHFKRVRGAWWGMLVYHVALFASVLVTLTRHSSGTILDLLDYSDYEHEQLALFFSVVERINVTVGFALMGVITIGWVALSRSGRDRHWVG